MDEDIKQSAWAKTLEEWRKLGTLSDDELTPLPAFPDVKMLRPEKEFWEGPMAQVWRDGKLAFCVRSFRFLLVTRNQSLKRCEGIDVPNGKQSRESKKSWIIPQPKKKQGDSSLIVNRTCLAICSWFSGGQRKDGVLKR